MSRRILVSFLLAAAAYAVCVLAQGYPQWSRGEAFALFPTETGSVMELVGFVTGIVGVYLMVVQSWVNYPVGLVWVVGYAWFFFAEARQYGDFFTMLVTGGYLLHGWRSWARKADSVEGLPVVRIERRHWLVLALTPVVFVPALAGVLTAVKGSFVWLDSLTTCLSLMAQYLTNRKVYESWWFWIVADVVYVGLFAYRGYYASMVLYAVFTVMAVVGMRAWRAGTTS